VTVNSAALEIANDSAPDLTEEARDILAGLTTLQKRISPKYFYDKRGSELFDQICELPEYYLTRTELRIMERHMEDMADRIGPRASVIEFGSGSSTKIRMLLDHLEDPAAYVPVDISPNYLLDMAEELADDYPDVQIRPVFADFTQPFELPEHELEPERNVVFFPGSTIGNFTRRDAGSLLEVMRAEARPGGALLIGVDLKKDPQILHDAYNDSSGVTAEFNLNVLRRLNRELGGDFRPACFRHEAVYDEAKGRIEMRLISSRNQLVTLAGEEIEFEADEYIITEYSHKYSLGEFADLARNAGLEVEQRWLDEDSLFSVQYLTVAE
jgi:dimethylhistidine N-methyltransferase